MSDLAARSPDIVLRHADDMDALLACWAVIAELRPSLVNVDDWMNRAWTMMQDGYRLLAAWRGAEAVGIAGYRIMQNLIHDRFLYVDDLVTIPEARGSGVSAALLTKLAAIGTTEGCGRLVLDTARTNSAARRFYQREGMIDAVVGFVKPLGEPA